MFAIATQAARIAAGAYDNAGDVESFVTARRYLSRRRAAMGASEALASAKAAWVRYGADNAPTPPPSRLWGAPDDKGLRWVEAPESAGLRFVGWADELAGRGVDHFGWYTDPDGHGSTLRGCVYALPHGRYLSGYRSGVFTRKGHDWTDDTGGARLACGPGDMWKAAPGGYQHDADSDSEIRAAAREADRLAQRAAETESEYQGAWADGNRYSDALDTVKAETAAARALLSDIKARKGDLAGPICEALRGAVRRHRETVARERAKARELWSDYAHLQAPANAWRSHLWTAFADGAGLE